MINKLIISFQNKNHLTQGFYDLFNWSCFCLKRVFFSIKKIKNYQKIDIKNSVFYSENSDYNKFIMF